MCVSSYSTTVDNSMFSSSRSGWLRWYREQFLGAHCHRIPPRPAYEMAHLTGETSHQLLGRSCIVLMIWQCLQRGIPSGKRLHNGHNYGKSPFSMGKLTNYKWSFSIAMLNYQRVMAILKNKSNACEVKAAGLNQ